MEKDSKLMGIPEKPIQDIEQYPSDNGIAIVTAAVLERIKKG